MTDYLKAAGSLSEDREMVNCTGTRTTQLYDRHGDAAPIDAYNKVGI
jgi:hypothetical protein